MIKKLQFLFYMTPSQWYDNYNCYNTTNNNCVNNSYSKKDDLWSNDELEIINGFFHIAQRASTTTHTKTHSLYRQHNNSSLEQQQPELIECVRFDCIYLFIDCSFLFLYSFAVASEVDVLLFYCLFVLFIELFVLCWWMNSSGSWCK